MIFFQILGVIFLVIVLVLGFFIYRFVRRLKKGLAGLKDVFQLSNVLPPLILELEKSSGSDWKEQDRLEAFEGDLKQAGFEHDGYFYTSLGESDVHLSLWSKKKQGLTAVAMEVTNYADDNELSAFATELFVRFADGSSLAVTSSQSTGTLPKSEHHITLPVEAEGLKALFAELKAKLPKDKKIKGFNDTVQHYKDVFEAQSEWLWEEQQLKSQEVKSIAEALGITLDDDMLSELLEHARSEKSRLLSQKIIRLVSLSPSMSAAKWEQLRNNLVVVHEQMNADEVSECLYEVLEHLSEEEEELLDQLRDLDNVSCPLTLFDEQLEKLQGNRKIKRIAQLDKPANAYVFATGL